MLILHGTWIPDLEAGFIQKGAFYLWVESDGKPWYLNLKALRTFLASSLNIEAPASYFIEQTLLLPTAAGQPLPSFELARYLETELPEQFEWQFWQIACYRLAASTYSAKGSPVIRLLHDLYFRVRYELNDVQFGSDLLFWHHYSQFLKGILYKDHYIPALKLRQLPAQGKRKQPVSEIYPSWQFVSAQYEAGILEYSQQMPLVCASGQTGQVGFWDRETLLRHFSENLLVDIVTHTPLPEVLSKQLGGSLVEDCLNLASPWLSSLDGVWETYQQWLIWKHRLTTARTATSFVLGLQLEAPENEGPWQLRFLVSSRSAPSWQLSLADYWGRDAEAKAQLQPYLGSQFEPQLLLALGYAARMWLPLWTGLHTDRPTGLVLTMEEAFTFLQEAAWVLEEAGYRVMVPAWWTPEGRRRAKVRLKAGSSSGSATVNKGYFSLDALVEYSYELAIGGETVSPQEWEALVAAKTPLVRFRGEWLALEQAQMAQLLGFWQSHRQAQSTMPLLEWMKFTANQPDLEVEQDATLQAVFARLKDRSRLELLPDPPGLVGTLRPYQQRGVSWLIYLEQLGLGACLADDMGLGKTIQVIARLVHEKAQGDRPGPTLLVAPTSVLGNWRKEIEKFAPQLRTMIHYGPKRITDTPTFKATSLDHDVVLTSFTLVRKDEKLLASLRWQRLVIDEAQNIKNPKAAQTKALLKISAQTRLALTGTPVENRLLDLWSIFHFLNPGYLGSAVQFRKSFELPIVRDNDRQQATILKRLVEPLILRRVKTDPQIIQDLPDKIEQKLFCQLTKEQASLYQAVTSEVARQINDTEGITRQGLILSTLMKLKQICNHPRQFLQDNSPFTPERSHKLSRLAEMTEEVIAEGESLLVFTQFHEIGTALERYFRGYRYRTYYIHGGVSRDKRERMITEFQDPASGPAVFILSLKAGGVGITLTRANHVFHFDRWWNPAVEDQATDRAFRIGQKKNVFVHKFVTLGTLEERIDQIIQDKKQLSITVVGTDESWLSTLDNERFKQLITLSENAMI
ncbi:DEAD/DEAH box helicase [Candidatus Cyanaurora vandensis]|uniref:DEAD/DEAH box helicase n=1 Tax=Candidatus Cyanaurora vandensis TaxID=2714958 RepID=UPI00257F176C|nr:DEAD/DEAH box helicase [Candidatus Cyanaurora vandensis]